MSIPRAEHPRPDFMREDWHNLNGTWLFDFDDGGLTEKSELRRSITVPFSWTSPLSGIAENRVGAAWYAKEVCWQPRRRSDRIWLCFMAVDYRCDVYVNEVKIGSHTGGYDVFSFDVTDIWKEGANRIAVRAQDDDAENQPRGKQGYGETRGIWQTVYLEARPARFIESIRFTTTIDGLVVADVKAAGGEDPVLDFGPGARGGARLIVSNPRLWSPDDPYLYEGTVTVGDDTVHTYFGIREIGSAIFGDRKTKWITLNGEPVYLNGTLDQSFNPQGHFTLPSEDDVIAEVRRLKAVGLNLVRIHIKPEEPRKLYWLDKLGVMVMADMACFWGEPLPETRAQFERELDAFIKRDWNHPSIIAWVIFNETWGLFSNIGDQRLYLQETRDWVLAMFERVKALDGTRLVEDNSPCNNDHIKTDINTWHFYINGYRLVKDHIADAVKNTYPGSKWNYIGKTCQDDAPLMNSECGMVWGVNGSAGESDIAWQYHYMLNEYRLHDAVCGFVFTEFHDVVNEFNGYYRLDNRPKDFGYQAFCEGMTIADLHAADFIAYDAPPCRTVGPGERVSTRLVHSNFDGATHGKAMTLRWRVWFEGIDWKVEQDSGVMTFACAGYGARELGMIETMMPQESAVAVLCMQLECEGRVLSRNFMTFDVRGEQQGISVKPKDTIARQFDLCWEALDGHKLCGAGEGLFAYEIDAAPLTEYGIPKELTVCFEASAKRVLKKDLARNEHYATPENMFTSGAHTIDPGENPNSYFMSDDTAFPSDIEVWVDGEKIHAETLPNDPADSRGVLSWHHQPRDRVLEEAGSYGYLVKAKLPPSALEKIAAGQTRFTLEIRSAGVGGLALYGRDAGRYAVDIVVVDG